MNISVRIVFVAVAAVIVAGTIVAFLLGRQRSARYYPEARAVVDKHCVACHSIHTTVPAFPVAAGGVRLDTADEMRRGAERILVRTVVEQNMPLLTRTGMTAAERAVLARWIEAGATVPRSSR
ncbi:MAG: hypothetical protein JNK60_22955 [Acidobacteria bacterium]|nr:hypothetical protein [Acidobacteriota bacterium]